MSVVPVAFVLALALVGSVVGADAGACCSVTRWRNLASHFHLPHQHAAASQELSAIVAMHGVEYTKRPTTGVGSWEAVDRGIHMQGKRQRGVKFNEFFKGTVHTQLQSSKRRHPPPLLISDNRHAAASNHATSLGTQRCSCSM